MVPLAAARRFAVAISSRAPGLCVAVPAIEAGLDSECGHSSHQHAGRVLLLAICALAHMLTPSLKCPLHEGILTKSQVDFCESLKAAQILSASYHVTVSDCLNQLFCIVAMGHPSLQLCLLRYAQCGA